MIGKITLGVNGVSKECKLCRVGGIDRQCRNSVGSCIDCKYELAGDCQSHQILAKRRGRRVHTSLTTMIGPVPRRASGAAGTLIFP